MKIKRLILYCLPPAGILFLTACDNELATSTAIGNDMSLPPGAYPLCFTAAKEGVTPQARLVEKPDDPKSTLWTAHTDQIGVRIGTDGAVGKYTLTAEDGSAMTADQQVYWQNTTDAYVYGWYPSTTEILPHSGSSINLADQSNNYLQFDFMTAKTESTVNYQSNQITLPFTHQMAKVNIVLQSKNNDLDGATVYVLGNTACTFDKGTVTPQGDKGDVKTYYDSNSQSYKAMIVPYTAALNKEDNFVKIVLKDNSTYYYREIIKLQAGKVYNYTITANDKELEAIDADGQTVELTNINKDCTITGRGTIPLTITGNVTVTLKDVNIKCTDSNVITVNKNCTLTLKVEGTPNRLETNRGGGIVLNKDANIKIIGNNDSDISQNALTVVTDQLNASDSNCSSVGIGAARGVKCGNIEIQGMTLTVNGASGQDSYENVGGAAIGTSFFGEGCGDITIDNSTIFATSGNRAAAIGLAYQSLSAGNITIKGKNTQVTVKVSNNDGWNAAGIGFAFTITDNQIGKITFTDIANTQELDRFISSWSVTSWKKGGYKIGLGDIYEGTASYDGIFLGDSNQPINEAGKGYGSWQ